MLVYIYIIQTMYDDALDKHGEMPSLPVPEQHRQDIHHATVHHAPVCGHRQAVLFTSLYGFVPSSVSARSHMLDLQRGTRYQPTFVLYLVDLTS